MAGTEGHDVTEDDEAAPPSAAETLRLIQEQQDATERSLTPDPRLIYWPWGIAWLIGFGLLFLRFGPHGRSFVHLPSWLPLTILYVLMVVAFVVSGLAGARAGKQVRGQSARKGAMYGWSWFLAFVGFYALAARLSPYLPYEYNGLLWAAGSVGIVGVLYLAGGAVWNTRDLFVLGLWVTLVNIAGVIAGPGWHSLVIAIGAGGGLLVAGAVTRTGRTTR
jgi:hypothetical protein